MRERRKALSPSQIDAASQAITERMIQTELFEAASIIFLYAAMPYEVQTWLIAQEARRRGKVVAYPSTDSETHRMTFYSVPDESELVACWCGKIAIKEPNPMKHQMILPNETTLMIVPGMAFDLSQNRLGYGGGYYDRYLAQYAIKTLGVGFDFSVVEKLPVGEYDSPLNGVMTDCRRIG
ncbi:MAG: 5-formyltetrahydrofolate cyclo-ligase [Cellulosilyticaceae bacterium]